MLAKTAIAVRRFPCFLLLLIGWTGICPGTDVVYDSYGGNKAIRGEVTGFFHLQTVDGRYFLITPEGHGYRALGINHFHNMTSKDYDAAIEQIKAWGFNAGCYQGPRWMWKRYPYTKGINLVPVSQWKPDTQFRFRDVFEADFLAEMEGMIREIVEPQSENPRLIGYFWTDIPLWKRNRKGRGWISFFKTLPPESAGGQKWREWKSANPEKDESDFVALIARQLYAKGHAYLRKYDGNHLIFGDRYHEVDIPDDVVREALPYIDAIAVQPTSREFNDGFFDHLYEQYGKPIYIADHVSSYATDEHPITMGQAARDPKSYGDYYKRYVTVALSRPYMIGFNKCQYQDEPSPKLLKQGLLRVSGEPYSIVGRVEQANRIAIDHAYSGTEPDRSNTRPLSQGEVRITSPRYGAKFTVGENVVLKATAAMGKLEGARVSFYYVDEKWKPIQHDDTPPFEASWKVPAGRDWTIYAAVHDADWKLLGRDSIRIFVVDANSEIGGSNKAAER